MKHLKRKLMMTLALLLTAVTSAWAESKPIGLNVEYEAGDVITTNSTGEVYIWWGIYSEGGDPEEWVIKISSSVTPTISELGIVKSSGSIKLDKDYAVYDMNGNIEANSYSIQCQGQVTGTLEKVHVISGSGTMADPYVFAPGAAAASATPVPLNWDATAKTATLTNGMPAGNVTVSVDYFAQAEFATSTDGTLAPTAIPNVPANTDAPIVTAGTVANIGTSEVKQGTLMYFVSQPTGNTIITAPTYDTEGWTDKVPTADGLAEGKAFVWYYIKGAEPANIADRTDDNTRSDSDIKPLGTNGIVTLAAEPTYTVTLNDEGLSTDEAAAWKVAKGTDQPAAFPLEGVKKTETVTVTYSGSKKIIGVKAEKKANASAPSLNITNPVVGQVIGSDGMNYAYASLPTGVTAVAKICYVSGSNGLALALADEGEMKWKTAIETCAAHTPAFIGGTWKLASQDEWNNMVSAASSYTALRDGFSSVGGTNLQSGHYWSSTEDGSDNAWYYRFYNQGDWVSISKFNLYKVRACLAF